MLEYSPMLHHPFPLCVCVDVLFSSSFLCYIKKRNEKSIDSLKFNVALFLYQVLCLILVAVSVHLVPEFLRFTHLCVCTCCIDYLPWRMFQYRWSIDACVSHFAARQIRVYCCCCGFACNICIRCFNFKLISSSFNYVSFVLFFSFFVLAYTCCPI